MEEEIGVVFSARFLLVILWSPLTKIFL